MSNHIKLFIPGPVEVRREVLDAQTQWMIGHRGKPFETLYADIQAMLLPVFFTKGRVYLGTHSGSGFWEAAARNLVRDNGSVLATVCGAFSERWADTFEKNGKPTTRLTVMEGLPITPELLETALRAAIKPFDAIAIVHNETSCGLTNPLSDLVAVIKRLSPETLILVDAVSSLAGVKIDFDGLGLDMLLTSSQKCFGLPPGLAMAAVSDRALAFAAQVPNRGAYFDLVEMEAFHKKLNTASTPAVSLLFALQHQLRDMHQEGLEPRFARHARMAAATHTWVQEMGLALFAKTGYASNTVTCVSNTRKLDIGALNKHLAASGMTVSDGYGKLKDRTFRIAHMADATDADLAALFTAMSAFIQRTS